MPLLRAPVARLLSLVLLALAPLACKDKPADKARATAAPKPAATPAAKGGSEAKAPAAANLFPREQLHASELSYTVLLVHPTAPKGDVVGGARKLLASKYKELNGAWKPEAPQPEVMVQALPQEEVRPIDPELLPYTARRLEAEERQRLLKARHATVLAFHVPFAQRDEALLAATRFAHQLAAEHQAFLWDAETAEYFSPQSWKKERLEGWSGGVPSVSEHITLHVYEKGEALRAISLGLAKFGLPDLVVEQVPQSMSAEVGRLVNAVAQLLAEGHPLSEDGVLEVDLAKVKDARLQRQLQEHTQKGASRRTRLQALMARRDPGDPENALLELGFPGSGTAQARQLAALDALFGPKDEDENMASAAADDPELEEVARKTRARLAELKPRVEQGLRPPEQLVVKAGFRTDDGNVEHMWLEVTGWSGGKLRGTLANEPYHVSGLRRGSTVEVAPSEVSDYLYMGPNGAREGGESARILMRREGR
jgi:uncharacterized protein YegJ (DUF2314 family)